MRNPFDYGGVVRESSFCNRREELAHLARVFENAEKLFLYSERRMGKTSLLKLALERLPKKSYVPIYIDLWPTNSEGEFAIAVAKALAESTSTVPHKVLDFATTCFARLQPSVTTDEEGKPKVVFGIAKDSIGIPAVEQILDSPHKVAAKTNKRLVVVLDEFQQITEYGNDSVERRIRSAIQHHKEIAYVFLGSKKHIIRQMFVDKQRPLYRSAAHYPLGPIATAHWLPFILTKFRESGKTISEDLVHRLVEFTGGHPFYTQHLCHEVWELSEQGSKAELKVLPRAIEILLKREAYAFTSLWDSLALNQKILLAAIAKSQAPFKPFAAGFIKQSGMRTASNIQRAAEALMHKDLIDRDDTGSLVISDKFLTLWIHQMTSGALFWDNPSALWDSAIWQ